MKVKTISAGYSERRQLVQYKLSAEVHAEVTAELEEGEDEEVAYGELMEQAKGLAAREMLKRVAEHKMESNVERDE